MRNGYTALLPATQCLFNKNKATLEEIASVWAPCTVQVMDRELNGKSAVRFVVGCGTGGYDRHLSVKHDQNFSYLGEFSQFGEIHLDDTGKVIMQQVDDGRELPAKAPVLVYK